MDNKDKIAYGYTPKVFIEILLTIYKQQRSVLPLNKTFRLAVYTSRDFLESTLNY